MSRFSKLEFENTVVEQATPVQAPIKQDETYYLLHATTAIEQGDFEEALRSYAKALEHNPQNPLPWTGQVKMLIELGEYREAKLWADKALEMFPHEPELLAAKSVALARTGDHKAAMAFSDASFSQRGNSTYLWIARADVLLAQKEARADFCIEKATSLDPSNWITHWLISRIHSHYGRFVQALASVQKALALDASRVQLWLQLAFCQEQLGFHAAAVESNSHALRISPRHLHAQEMAAHLEVTPTSLLWWRRIRHLFKK